VSRVVHNILLKRSEYKRLKKEAPDVDMRSIYDSRATALKWIMVTCFGYLGFKNARFGKIEAHECVSSYGREMLLQAKEIAEREGFHLVHANVDSLWLKKEGANEQEFKDVIALVAKETNFPMAFDGFYKWIRFCPAKKDPRNGVPNRYFGCFQDNELKLRGIELRRHDTPPLLKAFQTELLDRLKSAGSIQECRDVVPDLEGIYFAYQTLIRSCNIPAKQLAFSSQLSKDPAEYVKDTYSSIAAQQLVAAGIPLHPGETIQYVIASAKDKVKDYRVMPLALTGNYFEYDVEKYLELLERSFQTITDGLIERTLPLKSVKPRQMEFTQLDSNSCRIPLFLLEQP
jgi:DNA polymerase, archaea type